MQHWPSLRLPILAIRNFVPQKSPSEATAFIGRGLHRSAGRQQPLDHGVVAVFRCKVQRCGASERPQGWLKLKVQRCMVRWFFPIRNDAKAMEKSLLVWPQVWARLGNPLLHHSHISSRLGIWVALHTFIHALAQCLGLKLGQTLLRDSQVKTGNIHRESDEQGLLKGGPKTVSFLNQIPS